MKKKCFCRFLRLIPLLLAVPLFFASCSSDDSLSPVVAITPPQRPIHVEVSETPLGNTAGARQLTRADITNLTSLNYFEMRANSDRYTVTKNDRVWTVDPNSWPVLDNSSVTFYAYNYKDDEVNDHLDYYANSGSPYLNFTMEENASSQLDLLVAKQTTTYNASQGTVILTFDHACAALQFSIYKTAGVSGRTITVKKIVLGNVKKTGRYHFADNSWDNQGTLTNYTLIDVNPGMEVTTSAAVLPDLGYLFVVPQTLTAWNKDTNTGGTYLDVTLTDGGTEKTARIPFDLTLQSGYIQPLPIAIGTSLKDADGNKIFQ